MELDQVRSFHPTLSAGMMSHETASAALTTTGAPSMAKRHQQVYIIALFLLQHAQHYPWSKAVCACSDMDAR